jgi:hypothetical protein
MKSSLQSCSIFPSNRVARAHLHADTLPFCAVPKLSSKSRGFRKLRPFSYSKASFSPSVLSP